MKLYYFPLPGRAEASRIMLTISGADFEDVRFDRTAWVEKYKSLSPTGQAPFLELDDGTCIAQSSAIDRYVGKAGGFYPDDALQAAKVDMLTACLDDVQQTLGPTWSLPDDEKVAARQALFAEGGAAAQKLAIIEKMVASKMSDFFVSDKLSLADILVFVQVSQMCSGFFDGINKDSLSSFPELVALRDAVASHPDIVPMYSDKADDPVRSAFRPAS